jgi:flagellin-like protein
MPRRLVRGKDRAVSPVIATIIIVAVAIVMSIAVAYWVLGLAGTFTRYEKLEIMSMYATGNATTGWNITASVRNTGSAIATINMILINGRPIPNDKWSNYIYVNEKKVTSNDSIATLNPGESCTITITANDELAEDLNVIFRSGMSVEVIFHTAAGSDYPKVVVLP